MMRQAKKKKKSTWMPRDETIYFLTEKLKWPKEMINTGKRKLTIRPAAYVVACAFSSDLPEDIALAKLREYILFHNPEIDTLDFELHASSGHTMTGFPPKEEVLNISAAGCFYSSLEHNKLDNHFLFFLMISSPRLQTRKRYIILTPIVF